MRPGGTLGAFSFMVSGIHLFLHYLQNCINLMTVYADPLIEWPISLRLATIERPE